MTWLFSIGLHNAVIVILLAVLVGSITRTWKNAPIAHLLWLLVLVKLVTPPLVNLDLTGWIPQPGADNHPSTFAPSIAEGSRWPIGRSPDITRDNAESNSMADGSPNAIAIDEPRTALAAQVAATVSAVLIAMLPALTWIWVGGAGLVALLAGMRMVRFQRMLAGTLPASQRIRAVVDELTKQMGLGRSPDIRVVDGAVAPLVWCIGRHATVILPLRLLNALDEQQTAMVLAHELAHLRRGDHWVRVLELVVSVLYWWNPFVWWIRRRLHAAEEQCCDAWVAWVYPGRTRDYAESLLKAAELLPNHSSPLALASPFLRTHSLKERIEVVLKNRSRRAASRRAVMCVVLLAAVVIPAGVQTGQAASDDVSTATSDPAPPKKDASAALIPTSAAKGQDQAAVDGAAKAGALQLQTVGAEKPIAKDLQPFQGIWNFGACESILWHAKLEEIQTSWRWTIQGQEITWTRPGKDAVKLSFTVDPSKSPNQIDLTFLDGPDKAEKCRGIYEFERGNLWICITEPGAKVDRPTELGITGTSKTALLILQDKKPVGSAANADASPAENAKIELSRVDAHQPLAKELTRPHGTFKPERWRSDKWTAKPEEFQSWQWTIKGQEINWSRPRQEMVRLSFAIDATRSPPQIDLTFLNGPDKGEKCRGIFLASRHEINLCFQDPGAKVDRPTNTASKPGSGQTSLTLVPADILPMDEEVQALQGVWTFDIYYSDWWPERIGNPPLSRSNWRWTVKGNEIHLSGMKVADVKLSFTLDPSKSPRQIDMTFLDGPHKGKTLRGIYRFFAEDGCWICFADPDAKVARPTDVSYSTNSGRTMVSIQRVAPE